MSGRIRANLAAAGLAVLAFVLFFAGRPAQAQRAIQAGDSNLIFLVTGTVFDHQNLPVGEALVTLVDGTTDEPLAEDITPPNGRYAMTLDISVPEKLIVQEAGAA